MGHTIRDKKKLLARVRRIHGQVEGIGRALEEERECFAVLQTVAACRGALNGLMAELITGHVESHLVDPTDAPESERAQAAAELIDIVRSFLR